MQQDLQLSYPPPPAHYKIFTSDNIANNADKLPLLTPPPPLASTVGAYSVFGEQLRLQEQPPSLPEMGVAQLYESTNSADRATELKKLNHAILLNFMELLQILVKDPEEHTRKIEHIRLLFININYLLNEYRPHQARDTLKLLMQLQIQRRITMAADIQKCLSDMNAVFQDACASITSDPSSISVKHEASHSDDSARNMPVKTENGLEGNVETNAAVKMDDIEMEFAEGVVKGETTSNIKLAHLDGADSKNMSNQNYWDKKSRLSAFAVKLASQEHANK
ncbi:Mediator of RNA polymerase II transcription subunit 7 [Chytriomyces hyalinus]|nr:Mediator of RNA polymerase II transcription subunit 7 [Chytriomyces hyalinus]